MKVKAQGYITMYIDAEFEAPDDSEDDGDLKIIAAKEMKAAARQKGIPSHECELEIWSISTVE